MDETYTFMHQTSRILRIGVLYLEGDPIFVMPRRDITSAYEANDVFLRRYNKEYSITDEIDLGCRLILPIMYSGRGYSYSRREGNRFIKVDYGDFERYPLVWLVGTLHEIGHMKYPTDNPKTLYDHIKLHFRRERDASQFAINYLDRLGLNRDEHKRAHTMIMLALQSHYKMKLDTITEESRLSQDLIEQTKIEVREETLKWICDNDLLIDTQIRDPRLLFTVG